jgi:hypothetical protein
MDASHMRRFGMKHAEADAGPKLPPTDIVLESPFITTVRLARHLGYQEVANIIGSTTPKSEI